MATVIEYPSNNLKHYAYLRSLSKDNQELYNTVRGMLDSSVQHFSSENTLSDAVSGLRRLMSQERAKEKMFLEEMLPKGSYINTDDWTKLIKDFNEIFGLSNIFKRNIARIKNIANGSNVGKIDIVSVFDNYLTNAVVDFVNEKGVDKEITEKDIEQVIINSMEKAFRATDEIEGQEIQAYADLLKIVSSENNNVFVQGMIEAYNLNSLNQLIQKAQEQYRENQKFNKDRLRISGYRTKQGNALEIIENVILNQIKNFQNIHTGQTLMKADNIVLFNIKAEIDLLTTSFRGDSSVRLRNIERLEQFLSTVEQKKGFITYITDKSYNLTSKNFADNKGFTGQGATLENFQKVMNKVGDSNLDDLIFVLLNTGNGMIRSNRESETVEIRKYIATKIGQFLFDDVAITESLEPSMQGPNSIHVMNLNGIYIPFSVFLEAAVQAFSNLKTEDYTNYINVHFTSSSGKYTPQTDGLTLSDWEDYRNARMRSSAVTFHFFGDFVNFINQYL